MYVRALFALLITVTAALPAGAETLTTDRLLNMIYPSELATDIVSDRTAMLLTGADTKADRWNSRIVLMATKDKPEAVVHEGSAQDLQWSAGRLFFIAGVSGSRQIFSHNPETGATVRVTDLPVPVSAYRIAADGRRIALALGTYPQCKTLSCSAEMAKRSEAAPPQPRIYTELPIYNYNRFLDGSQIVPYLVSWSGPEGGAVVDASPLVNDAPHLALCNSASSHALRDQFAFVNSGVVACMQDNRATPSMLRFGSIMLFGKQTGAERREIGVGFSPVSSYDETQFAYLSHDRNDYAEPGNHVLLASADGTILKTLRAPNERIVESAVFSVDGRSLFVRYQETMDVRLATVDLRSGMSQSITSDGTVEAYAVGRTSISFSHSTAASAHSVKRAFISKPRVSTSTVWSMSDANGLKLGDFHRFTFAGAEGEVVHGAVVLPPDALAGTKLPVLLFIHGGPGLTLANRWHPRMNLQLYAARGFAVVAIDPHGSSGYGQAFSRSVHGDWGGKPLEDLRAGYAEALKRWPVLDESRACAFGQSYGGYMINWIASQWPDGFRCLVNHAGIMDMRSFVFQMDIIPYIDQSIKGTKWYDEEAIEMQNPIGQIDKWKTPMLLLHGVKDYRVPWGQGHAAFMALRRRNVPAKLVLFQDEGHAIMRPKNTQLWLNEMLEWMDEWTNKGAE